MYKLSLQSSYMLLSRDAVEFIAEYGRDSFQGDSSPPSIPTPSFASPTTEAPSINETSSCSPLVHPGIVFRRHLVPSHDVTYDLVISQRSLIELASEEARMEVLEALWRRTERSPSSYKNIDVMRNELSLQIPDTDRVWNRGLFRCHHESSPVHTRGGLSSPAARV